MADVQRVYERRKTIEKVKERERERRGVSRGFSLIESVPGGGIETGRAPDLYGGPFTRKSGEVFRR